MRIMPLLIIAALGSGCARPAGMGPEVVPASGWVEAVPATFTVVPPPDYLAAVEQGTRSPNGAPGPRYWQQWTEYTLHASLDPNGKRLEGRARIVYHNRSPRALPVVFLHLYQNLHAPGVMRNRPAEITGGVELTRVAVAGTVLEARELRRAAAGGYQVNGTILGIRLPKTLSAGGSIDLDIEWTFTIPQSGSGRMGWNRDDLFHVAYWYPQMAVFDDVVGWHLDPYLGSAEFYTGFGDYDVTIDAPEGWVVMASGALQNAGDVLPPAVVERLARAERSDTVVHVLEETDFGPGKATRTSPTGRLEWRFTADSLRDVAWSAMRESRWDAVRTPVGDKNGDGITDYARVDAFWRTDAPRWQHTARYAQHSIDFLSRYTHFPYPWPHMTAVEGGGIIGGGMEFPMMTLIGDYTARGDSALYDVTAHELAHMWMPMIVGIDETRYGWMDEGSTSFHENQARMEFYPGSDPEAGDRRTYVAWARSGNEGEMMRWTDFHYQGASGVASYAKPATALAALRDLLGRERFERAWRAYIEAWAYKHPKPWDFFQMMESETGEDLDWFWHAWYYETWTLDLAVESVAAGEPQTVTIANRGLLPMPTPVRITLDDGSVIERDIPVHHWLSGRTTATIEVPSSRPVVRVEIDSAQALPDLNRGNNLWERPSSSP